MGLHFNPPPGWPPAPVGFTPEPGWEPDPSWPPLPTGWQLWVNDDQPSWGNDDQPSWASEDHQPSWETDDQPSWANEHQPSWADHDQPSLVSEQQPAAAPPPPWAVGSPSPVEQAHGSGTSQAADDRQEAGGIFLTGGSYDDDSYYATPIGTADPGGGSDAPAEPAPVSTAHPANGNAAQAYATPMSRAEPGGYGRDAPSYANPVSTAGPGDGRSSTTPSYPAAVSTAGSGDDYGTLTPPHPGPAGGADHRYNTGTSSYPAPQVHSPVDGHGKAAGAPAGTPPAEGHYGQTWTVGSPYGGAADPYRSGQSPVPGSTTTGWAKASLVAGACFGVVIGAVLGLVALRKIAQTGQRGRAQAALGIVLSAFWTIVLVVAIIFAVAPSTPSRATNGQITNSGSLNVFSLSVGDCFANPPSKQDITSVTAVPCSQPHNAQVYAKFKLSGTDANYPGNVTQLGSNGCDAQKDHLNTSLTTDSMSIRFIYPVARAWKAGERTVTCLIVTPANVSSSLMNP